MITINIPGYNDLRLEHLVLDYNGTLAVDGMLIDGVKERLIALSSNLTIHVLTADTFGKAALVLQDIPCGLSILPLDNQDIGKQAYVQNLKSQHCVCIGNGRNDRLMLADAAVGICVILDEGASSDALQAADVVCKHINSALDLLNNPLRLTATLRS